MKKTTYIIALLLFTLLSCSAFCQSKQGHNYSIPEINSVCKDSAVVDYIKYLEDAKLAHNTANYKGKIIEFIDPIVGISVYDGFRYTENGMHIDRGTIREMADWKVLIDSKL